MPVVVGEANNQLIGGVIGLNETDTHGGTQDGASTTAGLVGLAGTQEQVDDWNGCAESNGLLTTAGVIGALPVVSQSGRPEARGLGFLAGDADPIFNQTVGVYGESDHNGVVGLSRAQPVGSGVLGAASQDGSSVDPPLGGHGVFGTGFVGVRGDTQSGAAVLGLSFGSGLAGYFRGDVKVTGRLSTGTHDVAAELAQLGAAIGQLQGQLAGLGMTDFGLPLRAPATRPQLSNTFQTQGGPGPQTISLGGAGFSPDGVLQVKVLSGSAGVQVIGQGNGQHIIEVQMQNGTQAEIVASDGRPDPNDVTGLLWSAPIFLST